MEITTDVLLRGTAWNKAIDSLSSIFSVRTNYSIFMLALSIGIMYDQRIDQPDSLGENDRTVPRNVMTNNDNGRLDYMFQAAILSTRTESYTEDQRLEYAFGDSAPINKMSFLTQFANFGVTKLVELIGQTDLESMDNIKNFLIATVEGRNLEIDSLPDDLLLAEYEE